MFYYIVIFPAENRATSRWNAMQSMNDAKKALKILFENVAVERRKTNSKNQEHDDLMVTNHKLVVIFFISKHFIMIFILYRKNMTQQ